MFEVRGIKIHYSSESTKKTHQHISASHYLPCICLCPQSWFSLSHVSFTFSTRSLYHLISISHTHTHMHTQTLHLVYFLHTLQLPFIAVTYRCSSVSFCFFLAFPHSVTHAHTHTHTHTCMNTLLLHYVLSWHFLSLPASTSSIPPFSDWIQKRTLSHWWLHMFWPFFFFPCLSKWSMLTASTTPTPPAWPLSHPLRSASSPTSSCESESLHLLVYQNMSRDLLYWNWCRNIYWQIKSEFVGLKRFSRLIWQSQFPCDLCPVWLPLFSRVSCRMIGPSMSIWGPCCCDVSCTVGTSWPWWSWSWRGENLLTSQH